MKTVIQVVQHLRPGGIETMALDLATFCQGEGNPLIISLEGDRESALAAWPKLIPHAERLIFLQKSSGLQPSLVMRLYRLFKSLDVVAVHTHHIGPLIYAGLAARMAGIKQLVHTEHDAWHLNDNRRKNLQRTIIKITHPILVADAQTVADEMGKKLNTKQISIVNNGIDTEHFIPGDQRLARQHLGLPQGVPIIGCSGRLETVKGQEQLIMALACISYDVHLALAGIGSTEIALRSLVSELGLSNRVHFLGRIDNMPQFYQALSLFCLPSLNEGFPLSPLEAQACNIPTAVTNVGGSHETLCPDSGELLPNNDFLNMARTLDHMLLHASKKHPREFITHKFDVRLMAQRYLHHYQPGE